MITDSGVCRCPAVIQNRTIICSYKRSNYFFIETKSLGEVSLKQILTSVECSMDYQGSLVVQISMVLEVDKLVSEDHSTEINHVIHAVVLICLMHNELTSVILEATILLEIKKIGSLMANLDSNPS